MEFYSLYDHTGIAVHLEKMAAKGWLLEKIGVWGWTYRRCEPMQVRFAVTYFPKTDHYEPKPTEDELTFQDYCKEAGWVLAASSAQLQIFYHPDPDAVPIETDALTQVENIHETGKKTFLMNNYLFLGLAFLQVSIQLLGNLSNPIDLFTQTSVPFAIFIWGLLGVLSTVDLITYYRWRKKALVLAEEEDRFLPTKSHPSVQVICLSCAIFGYLVWVLTLSNPRMSVYSVALFCCTMLLIGAVNGTRLLMKRLNVSASTNRFITILVDVILAISLFVGMTLFVIQSGFLQRKPVDTYEYLGCEREVYADPLPLYVDDLMECERSDYSSEIVRENHGLFGWEFIGFQNGRKDRGDELPGIWYYVVEVENDWAFEKCWEDRLDAYGGVTTKEEMTDPWSGGMVAEDPDPWQAEEVYRQYIDQIPTRNRLIRWEERFVWLELDWEPTPEQMQIITEKLRQFEP